MKPEFNNGGGVYKFDWAELQVMALVDRVHQHRDGHVTGELSVTTTAPGFNPHLLAAQFNLSSTVTRRQTAKALGERFKAPWDDMLEQICVLTIRKAREGAPVVKVGKGSEYDPNPNKFLLPPILIDKRPVTLYGKGGTGKSTLAQYFAILLQANQPDSGFTPSQQRNVLYLDWETDVEEMRERMHMLQGGLALEDIEIFYRRCAAPFADDVDAIHRQMVAHDINYLVIDSLGGACGGDIEKAEVALRFYQAYRALEVGALWITHVAKNKEGATTPFGSVYFWNYSRSIWEVVKEQEEDASKISIGLFHRKINGDKLHGSVGLEIKYQDGIAVIDPRDIKGMPAMRSHLAIKDKIVTTLGDGPLTLTQIAGAIGEKESSVKTKLNLYKNLFVHPGEDRTIWMLMPGR